MLNNKAEEYNKSGIQAFNSKQYDQAIQYFKKAIEIKDGQIDTLYFLSRYDLEAGDTAKAIERLELAAEGRFSPLNFANRAMIEDELKHLKG